MPARLPRPLLRLLVSALVLASAGCATVDGLRGPTGDPRVAATVDGVDIPIDELERRLATTAEGAQPGEDPDAQRATVVTQLVQETLLGNAASERGVSVTAEEIATTREGLVQQVGGEEALQTQLQQSGISEDDFATIVEVQALQGAITESVRSDVTVTDEEVETSYASPAGPYGPQTADLRQLVVATEVEGVDAIARVEGGEDFLDVAADVSTDPAGSEGVELNQVGREGIPPQFTEAIFSAEPGEVVGPIEAGPEAFVVLQVVSLSEPLERPPLADVEQQVREQLVAQRQETAVSDYFTEVFNTDVKVNPRFGVWDPEAQQVTDVGPLGRTEVESDPALSGPASGAGGPDAGAPGADPGAPEAPPGG